MRRFRVRARAGGRVTARCCLRWPYCRSGWWVVTLLGCRFGLCRGRRTVPWGGHAACRWSLRTGAPGGDVGVRAHGAEGSLGPGAGGINQGSGWCLCGRAVRRRVCGARRWSEWRVVVRVGLWVGLCRSCWRVDASGGVWGCGPGSPAGPGPGLIGGHMVRRVFSGQALAVAVFVWLGMVLLPEGEVWCSRIAVAAWCCGWCRCGP